MVITAIGIGRSLAALVCCGLADHFASAVVLQWALSDRNSGRVGLGGRAASLPDCPDSGPSLGSRSRHELCLSFRVMAGTGPAGDDP
jgi:hypothetical protein